MTTYLDATQYLQKAAIDKLLGISDTAKPAAVYLCLFTADPGEAGSLSAEIVGGGYGRQELTSKLGAFSASSGVATSTMNSFVQFGVPSADWGTVTHFGIADAVTGGNLLWKGELDESIELLSGSSPAQFVANSIVITIRALTMTTYAVEAVGDHFIGKTELTMPTACDMRLFEANPGFAGSLSDEADYGDYAAVEITSKMGATTLATGVAYNDDVVTFPAPSSGSNAISYCGISDGAGSPNLLLFTPLRHAFVVASGDAAPEFPVNSIAIQMT